MQHKEFLIKILIIVCAMFKFDEADDEKRREEEKKKK